MIFPGIVMYQNILVPVDGSTTSNLAIQEAARLAQHQEQNARLELVHVVADIHLMDANSYINYDEVKEIETSIGKKILAQAKRWPADLIVIGTHGRSGFSRVLFGSVAEGVVRTAHIPVLLIRGA